MAETIFIYLEKLNILKHSEKSHASAIPDHMTLTGHNIKWHHFEILTLIGDSKPA